MTCWLYAAVIATAAILSGCGAIPPQPPQAPVSPLSTDPAPGLLLLVNRTPGPGSPNTALEIFTVRPDGSNKRSLPAGLTPSWTPTGEIIFANGGQIWLMSAEGSNLRQLSNLQNSMPLMPQMGANGAVLFVDGPDNYANIRTLDGKVVAKGALPYLAPSGTWFTYTVQIENPYHRQIWRANIDGTSQNQLTFLGDPNYPDANASAISPDEKWVAVFSGKESAPTGVHQPATDFGYRNVAVVPADGGPRRTLTLCTPITSPEQAPSKRDCVAADNPAWFPDGSGLIFDTGFVGGTSTWAVNLDGSNFRRFYPEGRGVVRIPLRISGR